jgi:transcriptional regulator with XRE-family HTH domain
MVARDPDDRPDLPALAPAVLKGLRRLRGARPPQVAADLGMSLRAYEHFENGKGRLNVDRVHAFATLLNVDPFAILAGFEIRSPAFALRCADNKMMMIFMMALQEFDADAQDGIARLDPLTLMQAFTALFEDLTAKAREQERLVGPWNAGKAGHVQEPESPGPADPPIEDPEREPE